MLPRGRGCRRARIGQKRWPWVALTTFLLAPISSQAGSITLVPAWSGAYASERPTEILATFVSQLGGHAQVLAQTARGEIGVAVLLEAEQASLVSLPILPGADGALTVSVRFPDGTRGTQTIELRHPSDGPMAATTGQASEDTLSIIPAQLPRHPWGYGPIAGLTIDAAGLRGLDQAQTLALEAYLADCRPLRLTGTRPGTEPGAESGLGNAIRQLAGCSGIAVAGLDSVTPALADALPHPSRLPSPDAGALDVLSARTLLFLPYPLLLLALAQRHKVGPWLLVLPPAAALAYGVALPLTDPDPQLSAWSEMDTRDPTLRWVAMLGVPGQHESGPELPLPGALSVSAEAGAELAFALNGNGDLALIPPRGRPLTWRHYRVQGVAAAPFSVGIELSGPNDALILSNLGVTTLPMGWLLWRGSAYRVPEIAAGEHYRLDPLGSAAEPALPHPLAARAGDGPALLLPGIPPLAGFAPESNAWLLIRADRS